MSDSSEALPIDTVLDGRYRLTSEGTSQDLGIRYVAYDLRRDRQVALLVLAPRWGGAEALSRVQDAQRTVAGLGAPNLLPFEHVGIVNEPDPEVPTLYLVRAHPEAKTLADLLAQAGSMDVGSAVEITARMCEALTPAHHAGFVHGSLSPTSVLVNSLESASRPLPRTVTLVDAGLLPALRPRDVPPGRPWGRTPYLSPEQAAGEEIHPTADVYVIGSILYEMLTGRPPFRASDELVLALQHLRQEPPALQILAPGVPPALVQIVDKALAKEPAARYRNAGQLEQILRSQVRPALLPVQLKASARTPGYTDGPHARLAQPPVQQRLVVPPPPAQSPSLAPVRTAPRAPREIADIARPPDMKKPQGKAKESTGVDWLMIGLAIAALIAVLGLIPLWRTVYRRYAAPPPALAPALHSASLWLPDVASAPSAECATYTTPARHLSGVQTPGRHLSVGGHPSVGVTYRPAIRAFGSPAYGSGKICVVNCVFGA